MRCGASSNQEIFVDTQVLVYALQGKLHLPQRSLVSAVAAGEFLMAQSPDPMKANYYIPLYLSRAAMNSLRPDNLVSRTSTSQYRRCTDRIVLDFGNKYRPLALFNTGVLTLLINQRSPEFLHFAIEKLPKANQNAIRERFNFLMDARIVCEPLVPPVAERALQMLSEFTEVENLKTNFRNSVHDLLILATAIHRKLDLRTFDTVLSRFASKQYASGQRKDRGCITLRFSGVKDQASRRSGSKGYVNHGWRAEFSNFGKRS